MTTVSGVLKDNQGVAVQGSLLFQIVNYDNDVPRISATNIVVPIITSTTANASGVFSVGIQGNDTITPANTYYQVTYRDSLGKPVLVASYIITGATFDLDTATPLAVVTPAAAAAVSISLVAPSTFTVTGSPAGPTGTFTIAWANPSGKFPPLVVPYKRRWAYLVANTSGRTDVGFGITGGNAGNITAVSILPFIADQASNVAGNTGSSASGFMGFFGHAFYSGARIRVGGGSTGDLTVPTFIRVWIAISSAGAPLSTDVPVVPAGQGIVGFRLSTSADSTWDCVVANNLGQTTVPTSPAVAVDANFHNFEIIEGTNVYTFFADGVQVGSITTNLPPGTTAYQYTHSVTTLDTNFHALHYTYVEFLNNAV